MSGNDHAAEVSRGTSELAVIAENVAPRCLLQVRDLVFSDSAADDVILDGVTFDVHQGDRLAILGARKAGRSLLIQLIAGQVQPASGRISRLGRVSFPLGALPPFCDTASPIRFCIREASAAYGADPTEVAHYFDQIGHLGFDPDMPWQRLQATESKKLGIALGLAIPFDIYLFDDFSPLWISEGSLAQMFAYRKARTSFVFTTRIAARLGDQATHVALIQDGTVRVYDSARDGLLAFRAMTQANQEPGT